MENLSQEEIDGYKIAFNVFDLNGDGVITDQEMKQAMKNLSGIDLGPLELAKVMEMYDLNNDGKVTFEEFVQATIAMQSVETQKLGLRKMFIQYDKNNDGFIDKEELKDLLKTFGLDPDDEIVDTMINEMDANGDGKLNFEEFVNGFCKL